MNNPNLFKIFVKVFMCTLFSVGVFVLLYCLYLLSWAIIVYTYGILFIPAAIIFIYFFKNVDKIKP